MDENSSCWIRVAQSWAGKGWGAVQTPRIGHEVMVAFMDGDPDRPIIVGSVYNGTNQPPYAMPANATQSGVRSRSSTGGTSSNYNEILFEDRMGSEQLSFRAEKDHLLTVKHDSTTAVGHDLSIDAAGNGKINSTGPLEVTSNTSITLRTGTTTLTLTETGISLSGAQITVTGGMINIGDGTVNVTGAMVTVKAPEMLMAVPEGALQGPIPIPPPPL